MSFTIRLLRGGAWLPASILSLFSLLPAPAVEPEVLDFRLEPGPGNQEFPVITFLRVPGPFASLPIELFEIQGALGLEPADWNFLDPADLTELEVVEDGAGVQTVTARVDVAVGPQNREFFRIRKSLIDINLNVASDVAGLNLLVDGFFHDPATGETGLQVRVENNSGSDFFNTVLVTVEGVTPPGVNVVNHDDLTFLGDPRFNLIGQVPGDFLDANERSDRRPVLFLNSNRDSLDVDLRISSDVPPPDNPNIEIDVPRDNLSRPMYGAGGFADLRLVVPTSVNPETFELTQAPASPGGTGSILFGPGAGSPGIVVATSGGTPNEAFVPVRGDLRSFFAGDLRVTATSQGGPSGTESQLLTVLQLDLAEPAVTLVNDRPAENVIATRPSLESLQLGIPISVRLHRPGSPLFNDPFFQQTKNSVQFEPPVFLTDDQGQASFAVSAGPGGQGSVESFISTFPPFGVEVPLLTSLTNQCLAACGPCPKPKKEDVTVKPYSGEITVQATDLAVEGRGFDYHLSRVYRSQGSHVGPASVGTLGNNWCLSYADDFLVPDCNNVVLVRSNFRTDVFTPTGVPGEFEAPQECYEQLRQVGNTFELRGRDGGTQIFNDFTAGPGLDGRLTGIEDRNGNRLTCQYTQPPGLTKPVLTEVVDTMGRLIEYRYYQDSDPNPGRRERLREVEDFRRDGSPSGRVVRFDYTPEGDLAVVTGPAVTGTPTGNDFPNGKSFRYRYLTPADLPGGLTPAEEARLLGNLTHIWAPNEVGANPGVEPPLQVARYIFSYGADPFDPLTYDRVVVCSHGGTNGSGVPAGGQHDFAYTRLPGPSLTPGDPFVVCTETDRLGNVERNTYSAWDTLLRREELTSGFRPGEAAAFETVSDYDEDKNLVSRTAPEGDQSVLVYDRANPDRFQQGNLLSAIRLPGPRGGGQGSIEVQTVYEPVFNQRARIIDPRGTDPGFVPPLPEPAGRPQADRFTTTAIFDYQEGAPGAVLPLLAAELKTTQAEVQNRLAAAGINLGLGDVNGDGLTDRVAGNVIARVDPSPVLVAGFNQEAIEGDQLQDVVTTFAHNALGQLIATVDPEGNRSIRIYFPETDPDGDGNATPAPLDGRLLDAATGGYLSQSVDDQSHLPGANNNNGAPPAAIAQSFEYDDVGNVTGHFDGRGIRYETVVNELDQAVVIVRAAAVPGVSASEPVALTAFGYLERTYYDFNDNVVAREVEDRGDTSNTGGMIDTTYTYDILDHRLSSAAEVETGSFLVTEERYDANENRTLVLLPEGNAETVFYDERDLVFVRTRGATGATPETLGAPGGPYDPRGGTPSTTTFHYDLNANMTESVDGADTDGSPANNSAIAGAGDRTRLMYDGFDRLVSEVDAVGGEKTTTYDPAGNEITVTERGTPGGASPTDDSGAANVDLRVTTYTYDELNRVIGIARDLFIPANVALAGAPALVEGPLAPGDSRINNIIEYDRNSRRTFVVEDDAMVSLTAYDGVNRVIEVTDPAGNIERNAYDANHNLIEIQQTDSSQVAGVADEIFVTTCFYDSLNRMQREVDNLGQSTEYRYDSRGNVRARSDAEGPSTGATISRRAFAGGALTSNAVNDFGNVTISTYDGLDRRRSTVVVLTASGNGDGVNIGVDVFGISAATPLPDASQAGDGLITEAAEFDGNSLVVHLTDDNGNRTTYGYDNLNRMVSETKGASVAPNLADRIDPATIRIVVYDPDDNVIETTDENGSVRQCTFDAVNRLVQCDIIRAAGTIGSTLQTCQHDGLDRKRRCTDNNDPGDPGDDSVVTVAYDSLGRVIEETQKLGSLATRAVSFSWTADNHRTSLVYPNGRRIDATYDAIDRLATITDAAPAAVLASYRYIGVDRVLERVYPQNGTRLTALDNAGTADIGHDGLRRIITHRNLDASNATLSTFTYGYDRRSNKLGEGKTHDPPNDESYAYDSSSRLVQFDRPNGGALPPDQAAWTLDGVGNWKQVDAEARQHSSFNELIDRGGSAIAHDNNGNEVLTAGRSYEFDAIDRLRRVSLEPGGILLATYTYDAVGRRVSSTVHTGPQAGRTDYYYDGWRVIEERDAADAVEQQYVFGRSLDELLVIDRNQDGDGSANGGGDRRLYVHSNVLESAYALTDLAGTVVESYQYDAYGRRTVFDGGGAVIPGSLFDNPYGFTGRRVDAESGLYYYRTRYLETAEGRFLSRDRQGYVDGLNLYSYVNDQPTRFIDPTGEYIIVPRAADRRWFLARLAFLCPQGGWTMNANGVVSPGNRWFCRDRGRMVDTTTTLEWICGAESYKFVVTRRGCLRSTRPTICCCICDATVLAKRIELHNSWHPHPTNRALGQNVGGYQFQHRGIGYVWVGGGRPLGYRGAGDPTMPAGRVRSTSDIILAHELCGHALRNTPHPTGATAYTATDPVLVLENRMRRELGRNWGQRN